MRERAPPLHVKVPSDKEEPQGVSGWNGELEVDGTVAMMSEAGQAQQHTVLRPPECNLGEKEDQGTVFYMLGCPTLSGMKLVVSIKGTDTIHKDCFRT